MNEKLIRVLLIEDSAFDAKLIQDMLKVSGVGNYELVHRLSLTEAFQTLGSNVFDVILLDLALPESQGLDTLDKITTRCPRIPVIVLTREDDEAIAIKSVGMGAQDYLSKNQLEGALLKRAIHYGMERKQMEEELRRHRENLEELVAARTVELIESNKQLIEEISRRNRAENSLQDAFNQLKNTQDQLVEAEKMEIVGRLSSGVAHEVKNPLAIILQGLDYLGRKIPPEREDLLSTLKYMAEAVERANSIVKGLLDFSGVSRLESNPQQITPILEKTLLLMKHTFDRTHINVIKDFQADLPQVRMDQNRFEQVFLNLLENSAQAMPNGGELKVSVHAEKLSEVDEGVGKRRDDLFRPGEEVIKVVIEDSGFGIPEYMLDKVCDPFFTTKRDIGGTGLGLSIVKNIVESHHGKINISNKNDSPGVRVTLILKTATEGG